MSRPSSIDIIRPIDYHVFGIVPLVTTSMSIRKSRYPVRDHMARHCARRVPGSAVSRELGGYFRQKMWDIQRDLEKNMVGSGGDYIQFSGRMG